MKNVDIIFDPAVRCEGCSHMYRRNRGDACLKEIPMPMNADITYKGRKAPPLKCSRFKSHEGPHTACILQPRGDRGSEIEGLWKQFHVAWED